MFSLVIKTFAPRKKIGEQVLIETPYGDEVLNTVKESLLDKRVNSRFFNVECYLYEHLIGKDFDNFEPGESAMIARARAFSDNQYRFDYIVKCS